jgi:predicted metalloprotease with PDZ domain
MSTRTRLLVVFLSFVFASCTSTKPSGEPDAKNAVSYTVDATKPESGVITITMDVSQVGAIPDDVMLCIPSWAPGAYSFTEYGKYITSMKAETATGDTLPISYIKSCTWLVRGGSRLKRVVYSIRDMPNKSDGTLWAERTEINASRVYANGTNIFMYLLPLKPAPCKVSYQLPQGWRVSSAIETAPNTLTAAAKDYDELVDSPVIMGKYERYDLSILNKPHSIILDTDEPFKADSLLVIVDEVVKAQHKFFGELPYPKYHFQFRLTRPLFMAAYGALEHRASSSYNMPLINWQKVRQDQLTNVISHEFFHLWNPKRIHSEKLSPFDYQNRIFTPNIWFAEGITDYYADLLLAKSGIISQKMFLNGMLSRLRYMKTLPNMYSEGLEALSLRLATSEDAMEMLPFYMKGTLVGMLLDIELRSLTKNRYSTDALMRDMNARYGKPNKPFPDDSLIYTISSLANADLMPFYTKYVRGTDTLKLREVFKRAGILLKADFEEVPFAGYLALPDSSETRFEVTAVLPNSTAEKMGLKLKDEIISIDGITTEQPDAFAEKLMSPAASRIGDEITIVVKRKSKLLTLRGKLGSRKSRVESLELDPNPDDLARRIRESMFSY